ncbi:MAG: LemA family protein [Acidobacteria bacterium]|jgi:LemA protein|nr:LemA family protein [Acidobacteriota bacterium]
MKKTVLLTIVLFVAFGLSGCSYNSLTAEQQQVRGAWADVESQLQRRADLIPNLIKTAQMSAFQEQEVFGEISAARSRLLNATAVAPAGEKTPEQREAVIEAANSFGGTIGRLLSLQENYPQLRSNELFLKAQDELAGTENRIATKREDYNQQVVQYNTMRNQFPAVITASLMGFKEEPTFKADPSAAQAPNVGDPNSMRRNSNQ